MTILTILVPLVLVMTSAATGCNRAPEGTPLGGEVSFLNWDGPAISGGTLWIRVYEQEPDGGKGPLLTEHTEPDLDIAPELGQHDHPFSMYLPTFKIGATYLIEVHVDVGRGGNAGSGGGGAYVVEGVTLDITPRDMTSNSASIKAIYSTSAADQTGYWVLGDLVLSVLPTILAPTWLYVATTRSRASQNSSVLEH